MPTQAQIFKQIHEMEQRRNAGNLSDLEEQQMEMLKRQIVAEAQDVQAQEREQEAPQQARSVDDLRALHAQMVKDNAPYSQQGAAAIQRGAMESGYQPEKWAKNLKEGVEPGENMKKMAKSIRNAFGNK